MRTKPKKIEVFLYHFEDGGIIKITSPNSRTVLIKIPREHLGDAKNIPETEYTGVYMLVNSSINAGMKSLYIGQAGPRNNNRGLLCRIEEHARRTDWEEALLFIRNDNSLGSTEINFLENRFYKMAYDSKRFDVQNANEPSPGNVTQSKESELYEYIEEANLLMDVLGFNVIKPKANSILAEQEVFDKKQLISNSTPPTNDNTVSILSNTEESNNYLFYYRSVTKDDKRSFDAQAKEVDGRFIVLSSSKIATSVTNTCPEDAIRAREEYATLISKEGILSKNISFNSPSAAAKFVSGSSVNGYLVWRDKNDISLKDVETAQIPKLKPSLLLEDTPVNNENIFTFRSGNKDPNNEWFFDATVKQTNEGFLLLTGSEISKSVTPSCPSNTIELRKRYLHYYEPDHILTRDLLFETSSSASNFVKGASTNGKDSWKNNKGLTIKQLE